MTSSPELRNLSETHVAVSARGDPAPGRAGWNCNPDQEERIGASRRDAGDRAREVRGARRRETHRSRIASDLLPSTSAAHYGADDIRDRPCRATELGAVDHESFDFEVHGSGLQIYGSTPASGGPRKRSALDIGDGIDHVLGGDHPDDGPPAHKVIGSFLGKSCRSKQGYQQKGAKFLHDSHPLSWVN